MSAIHPFLNQITEVNASYIDRLFDEGMDLINRATNEIMSITDNVLPDIDFSGVTPSLIDPSSVAIGALPTMPTKPVLMDVPIGTMPESPVLTMGIVANDSLLTTTISNIIAQIQQRINYATGLRPDIEQAIFGRGIDRETKTVRNSFNNFLSAISGRGWSSPSGQNKSLFATLETEKRQKLSELSREIMNKQAELEQSNIQQNLVLYQTLNAQLADMKRSDEANKVSLYGVSIDAIIKKAQVYIAVNQSYVDTFASEVQAYAALSSTILSDAKLRLEQVTALNTLNIQYSDIAMKKLELLNAHDASKAGLANEASKAIASIMSQLSATLMNSINISESFSTGKSWSYGESVST
jgi:hypothetical protein